MDKDELTAWALKNGWQMLGGHPSLTNALRPKEPIVRLVLKATVANVEIKRPAGKWEKVAGTSYDQIMHTVRAAPKRPSLQPAAAPTASVAKPTPRAQGASAQPISGAPSKDGCTSRLKSARPTSPT